MILQLLLGRPFKRAATVIERTRTRLSPIRPIFTDQQVAIHFPSRKSFDASGSEILAWLQQLVDLSLCEVVRKDILVNVQLFAVDWTAGLVLSGGKKKFILEEEE